MRFICIFMAKNLVVSKIVTTFASLKQKDTAEAMISTKKDGDLV